MTDPAPARMVIDQHALFATLAQIQTLEHQRQWCEMDQLTAVEEELEIQQRHLKRLLCPGMSNSEPLPALTPPPPVTPAPALAGASAPLESEALEGWTELHVVGGALYGSHPQWKSMMCIAAPVQVCTPSQRLIEVDRVHKIMGRLNEAEAEFGVDLSGIWCAAAELVTPPQALAPAPAEGE